MIEKNIQASADQISPADSSAQASLKSEFDFAISCYAVIDRKCRHFSEQEVTAVWSRAQMIPGLTPRMFRLCSAGRIIARADYNDRSSSFGWRIDHIVRLADGGTNSVTNLQPLNWQASSKSV